MKKNLLLSFGTLAWLAQSASAQVSIFTTTNDFALFSNGGAVPNSSYYSDSSAVNGVGNTSDAGGAGGVGSLQLTMASGWGPFVDGPGANQAVLSALDPGALAPYSAGSGGGPGSLVAYSGTLSFDVYRGNLTDWNQFGILFNYNGHWDNFFSSTATDFTGADGNTWTHVEVPYTISANNAALTYFGISISRNAGANVQGEIAYVDNFQVAVVPEPGTLALLALGGLGGLIVRRRAGR